MHFRFSFEPRFSEVDKSLFLAPPLRATSCNVHYSGSILYDNERETWSKSMCGTARNPSTKYIRVIQRTIASFSCIKDDIHQLSNTWFLDSLSAHLDLASITTRSHLNTEWTIFHVIFAILHVQLVVTSLLGYVRDLVLARLVWHRSDGRLDFLARRSFQNGCVKKGSIIYLKLMNRKAFVYYVLYKTRVGVLYQI